MCVCVCLCVCVCVRACEYPLCECLCLDVFVLVSICALLHTPAPYICSLILIKIINMY